MTPLNDRKVQSLPRALLYRLTTAGSYLLIAAQELAVRSYSVFALL